MHINWTHPQNYHCQQCYVAHTLSPLAGCLAAVDAVLLTGCWPLLPGPLLSGPSPGEQRSPCGCHVSVSPCPSAVWNQSTCLSISFQLKFCQLFLVIWGGSNLLEREWGGGGGGSGRRGREKVTWCFMPSQPLQLYLGEERERRGRKGAEKKRRRREEREKDCILYITSL